MIKEEAYELMGKGYAVTHRLFKKGEYLYMNDSFIIKDEEGITFEADWDTRTSPEWLVDWFVYKGKIKQPSKINKRLDRKSKRIETGGVSMWELIGSSNTDTPTEPENDEYSYYIEDNDVSIGNDVDISMKYKLKHIILHIVAIPTVTTVLYFIIHLIAAIVISDIPDVGWMNLLVLVILIEIIKKTFHRILKIFGWR